MIKEPCSAELSHGLYGDKVGFLTRFKRFKAFSALGSGYAVWFPAMNQGDSSVGAQNNGASCFFWENANAGTPVPNTLAVPYGNAANPIGSSAETIEVAGDAFTQSAVCSSQRTLAACMRLRYVGRMDATSGEVAVISGLTANQLFNLSANDAGVTSVPSNVNDIFQLSTRVSRLSLDGHEVRFRPTQNTHTFVPSPVLLNSNSAGAATKIGIIGTSITAMTPEASALAPEAIIIAWRNVTAASPLILETYVGIEWVPNASNGLQAPPHVDIGPSDTFSTILRGLDRAQAAWDTVPPPMQHGAVNMVASMAQAGMSYFGGGRGGQLRLR
jgi:hypothetical protein